MTEDISSGYKTVSRMKQEAGRVAQVRHKAEVACRQTAVPGVWEAVRERKKKESEEARGKFTGHGQNLVEG